MEEIELIDTPLAEIGGLASVLLRFFFNMVITLFIIRFQYYPRSKRSDYFFTFTLISLSVFFLIFLLGGVKLKIGFALGLFAIFGIIRYRTEGMPVREMTYLFVLIALSVINALAASLTYTELLVINLLFIGTIWLCESGIWIKRVACKYVMYDRIDLIHNDKMDELIEDLRSRTGLNIVRVEVGALDFLRDTAMLKVYYTPAVVETNTVDKVVKMPKVEEI